MPRNSEIQSYVLITLFFYYKICDSYAVVSTSFSWSKVSCPMFKDISSFLLAQTAGQKLEKKKATSQMFKAFQEKNTKKNKWNKRTKANKQKQKQKKIHCTQTLKS